MGRLYRRNIPRRPAAAMTLQRAGMLKFSRCCLTLVFGFVLMLPAAAQAQGPAPMRQGFWFSGGFGWGTLGCQDCSSREGGFSGSLAIGGTLSSKLLLGAGTHGWTKEENGVRLSAGTLTAQVRFYPSSTGNFFLLGGLGVGQMDIQISGFGSASEMGVGAVLGLGYDIRIGSNVSLTPFWNGVALSNDNGDANFGQIGLSITTH
jgi:hypothetical protein